MPSADRRTSTSALYRNFCELGATRDSCNHEGTYLQIDMQTSEWILAHKIVENDGSAAVVGAVHERRHHIILEGGVSAGRDITKRWIDAMVVALYV